MILTIWTKRSGEIKSHLTKSKTKHAASGNGLFRVLSCRPSRCFNSQVQGKFWHQKVNCPERLHPYGQPPLTFLYECHTITMCLCMQKVTYWTYTVFLYQTITRVIHTLLQTTVPVDDVKRDTDATCSRNSNQSNLFLYSVLTRTMLETQSVPMIQPNDFIMLTHHQ